MLLAGLVLCALLLAKSNASGNLEEGWEPIVIQEYYDFAPQMKSLYIKTDKTQGLGEAVFLYVAYIGDDVYQIAVKMQQSDSLMKIKASSQTCEKELTIPVSKQINVWKFDLSSTVLSVELVDSGENRVFKYIEDGGDGCANWAQPYHLLAFSEGSEMIVAYQSQSKGGWQAIRFDKWLDYDIQTRPLQIRMEKVVRRTAHFDLFNMRPDEDYELNTVMFIVTILSNDRTRVFIYTKNCEKKWEFDNLSRETEHIVWTFAKSDTEIRILSVVSGELRFHFAEDDRQGCKELRQRYDKITFRSQETSATSYRIIHQVPRCESIEEVQTGGGVFPLFPVYSPSNPDLCWKSISLSIEISSDSSIAR